MKTLVYWEGVRGRIFVEEAMRLGALWYRTSSYTGSKGMPETPSLEWVGELLTLLLVQRVSVSRMRGHWKGLPARQREKHKREYLRRMEARDREIAYIRRLIARLTYVEERMEALRSVTAYDMLRRGGLEL